MILNPAIYFVRIDNRYKKRYEHILLENWHNLQVDPVSLVGIYRVFHMIKQLDHFRVIIPNPEEAKSLVLFNAYYNKLQLNKINHKFEGVCLFKTLIKS